MRSIKPSCILKRRGVRLRAKLTYEGIEMTPKITSGVLTLLVYTFLLAGCQTQAPRLPAYLGQVEGLHDVQNPHPQSLPSAINQVGVLVMTDTSFPNSALPLSPDMLAILENRLVK